MVPWRSPQSRDGASARDLAAVMLVTTTASLPVFLVGTMAVEMRRSLHFGSAALGVAVAFYYLGAAVSSVPASRLVERVGGVRVMRVAVLATAVLLGLLDAETSSVEVLTVLLAASGTLSGSMNPATNLFLARRASPRRQGFAFGVKQSAVPLASVLGGIAVPAVALNLGWRWAFGFAAVLALLATAVVPAPRVNMAERRRQHRETPQRQVRSPALVVLSIGLALGVLASSGCTAFLVSGAVSIGYGKGAAGIIAAVAGLAAVTTRIGTGARADRRGGRHFPVVAVMLCLGALGYILLATGTAATSRPVFALGAVAALGMGWGWNGLFNFAVVHSHPDFPATATGITQVGGRLGGVAGPVLLGIAVANGSYTVAWLVAGLSAVCGAAAMLIGRHLLLQARAAIGS